MLHYVILVLVFSFIECFHPELSNLKINYTRYEAPALFEDNVLWKQGDIPLLNKKVFKGMRVTIREHPYVVSVRRNIMHYLVATMLSKNLFISVAHPLVDVPLDELTVVVGENYADRGSSLLTVMLLIFHENFDRYTLKADLVLIRVYENTPYRSSVKSIQLVNPKAVIKGQRAFVTGWGRCDRTGRELCLPRSGKYTPTEVFDPMLRTVSFVVTMPNIYCEGYKHNGVPIFRGMLCAGGSREEDEVTSCLAVPGAPLVVNAHLAGILSWGFGCGYKTDLPLVYTSVQYYQPWLLHNIPILRLVTKENLTILFEAKRAYILSKWLNMTRIVSPQPFSQSGMPLEMLKLDKELAKLKGHVYDIRDYVYDGKQHKYKLKLYEKLRQKLLDKGLISHLRHTYVMHPFLNMQNTEEFVTSVYSKPDKLDGDTFFYDETDKNDDDTDKIYIDYDYN